MLGTVLLGDLIFVYHAIPIVIVEAIQCLYYPVCSLGYFMQRGSNRLSRWAMILGLVLIGGVFLEFFFTVVIYSE
jgi:hypothetical protein